MTQTEAILRLLQDRDITALDALSEVGCLRLAARIAELKDAGHQIRSTMIRLPNGKHVAKYHLHRPAFGWICETCGEPYR